MDAKTFSWQISRLTFIAPVNHLVGGRSIQDREEAFTAVDGRGSLFPDYEGFTRKDGTVRAPDVTTFKDRAGEVWVRGVADRNAQNRPEVSAKEGLSVSTSAGGFGYSGWFYFLLPKGTSVPVSLDVKATPTRNDLGHYSIRCLNLMRLDAYEGALDTMARSALAKAVEAGKQSFRHS